MVNEQPSREALCNLAHALGVETEYWGYDGTLVQVDSGTIVRVLTALGVEAGSDELVERALEDARLRPWRETIPPCTVIRESQGGYVAVHLPHGMPVRVEVRFEQGSIKDLEQVEDFTEPTDVDGVLTGQASFRIPEDSPLGYHTLCAHVGHPDGSQTLHEGALIVVPQRLPLPSERNITGWGAMAQLYSVRSHESWGIGDTADLREVCSLFGDLGADFLLINPLHAAEPVGHITPSPYLPVTRRFFNPIYIRPEDIPEVAYMPAAQRALVTWAGRKVKAASGRNETIDRDAAWSAKLQALEAIYRMGRSQARQREFERFRAFEGKGLEDFALWSALREKYGENFPDELNNPDSPFVARERQELSERVDFFAWLQWVMDSQLERAQRDARNSGMELGIIHDLAVGVHAEGADVWSISNAFAYKVCVGAPPDMYNQRGQNWSQPPWRPDALRELAYAPLRDMTRTVVRHAGGIRIDHVMGLFRLWWIPEGSSADQGTYVRYDHEAMVGVVMLEAQRAGAVLVGEDLGVVEPWVSQFLHERGILGTSVMWFEQYADGSLKQPWDFPRETLVTVGTHDQHPAAGQLALDHVALREELGLLKEPPEKVRADAERERDMVVQRLREHGLIDDSSQEQEMIEAMYAYVAKCSAELTAIALVDAVGEKRTQNMPGTDNEYDNWRVPLADETGQVVMVEDLVGNTRLNSLVGKFSQQLSESRGVDMR